ncbi:SRPBCC family protein [Actinoplanes sp. NPDC049316]|uniref:SRPBCC family protein n=1 Tax=Actinoplanes sp. NPDC049316 TaxID=3154727 RepID=UPI0034414A9E
MTTRITGSFPFTAPAEVVFDVLTDPDRTYRWLPEGMTTEPRSHGYAVSKDPAHLSIQWARPDGTGLTATATVRDAPAGGSILDAELELPDTLTTADANSILADTMTRLQRDVSDNFNAG